MFDRFFPTIDLAESKPFDLSKFRRIKTDIQDLGDRFKIEMDLPGYTKDEVKIKLENGVLVITATKSVDEDMESKTYICKERSVSTVCREFNVGAGVLESDVSAKMENGVLELEVIKKEPPKDDSFIEIK